MLKHTIEYEDFNGLKRVEDFYFNLSKTELQKMELMKDDSMSVKLKRIINANDVPAIMLLFDDILLASYGEKSADGRLFLKNEEIRNAFKCSGAYDALFQELFTGDDAAIKLSDFINGIFPHDLIAQAKAEGLLDEQGTPTEKAQSSLLESK